MSIKEIIELLIKEGYEVEARKRADGGYFIRKINGESFRGSLGNAKARKIVGAELSQARTIQLQRIRFGHKKLAKIPDDLKKELQKVQRLWRKKHPDIRGTLSMRGLRFFYQTYGKEAAHASLQKSFRYAQGLAYIENVNWLVERLNMLKTTLDARGEDTSSVEQAISIIESRMLSFKEEWIHECYEAIYECEKGGIDADELARRIKLICQ